MQSGPLSVAEQKQILQHVLGAFSVVGNYPSVTSEIIMPTSNKSETEQFIRDGANDQAIDYFQEILVVSLFSSVNLTTIVITFHKDFLRRGSYNMYLNQDLH